MVKSLDISLSLPNISRDFPKKKKNAGSVQFANCKRLPGRLNHVRFTTNLDHFRIHGAATYANINGVYWWDPWHTIDSSTMDPSWVHLLYIPYIPSVMGFGGLLRSENSPFCLGVSRLQNSGPRRIKAPHPCPDSPYVSIPRLPRRKRGQFKKQIEVS